MCRALEVSRSGFYAWMKPKAFDRRRFDLLCAIRKAHDDSRKSYGSPRIWRQLQNMRLRVSKSTVERLMREHSIQGKKRRRFQNTTNSQHTLPLAENIVSREFDRGSCNKVWLSDITYLRMKNGWAYLAAIIDGHSRKVVGWSIAEHMREELVSAALKSAFAVERPQNGLLLHSDRGSQYASQEYRRLAESRGLVQSMSRRGNCWDNAPMESFFDTLKTELVDNQVFISIEEARSKVFDWIEVFYNRKRMHSALGYLSPTCFEKRKMTITV